MDNCVVEGIMALRTLERLLEEKKVTPTETRCVVVETPAETCLERRLRRAEHADAAAEDAEYFKSTVVPMHELHCRAVAERLSREFDI